MKIRRDVEAAKSRPALTELYMRAGYLITLTHSQSWAQKFGNDAAAPQDRPQDQLPCG